MLISLGCCLEFQKLKNNELSRLSRKMLCCFISIFLKSDLSYLSEASVQTEFVYINLQSELQLNKLNELLLACAFPPHPPRRRRQTTDDDDDDSKQSIKFGFLHLEFPTWTMIDRLVISALSCNSENLFSSSSYMFCLFSLCLSLSPSLPN